ncbi:periplasmic heavy metal sensor [Corallococcus sicarius]|uniref:Periplasmic heavy metal sensor n=1 Tax=Corallococcus sicarius TaxID=2316726 RepID=A0A3A8NUX9_9BACT|nr:periplasmic heavy metal sensor [Corallococcus sicarius]RKH45991.1 periplasmic heavy metal sensor [Corallococcus sicarius]
MFGFVFGTACLAGLFATLRRGRHGHPGYGHGGMWRARPRLRWLFERLETSPGQEKVIVKAVEDAREAFAKVRDQWGPSRTALGTSMRGEHFDGAVLRELFSRHDVALETLRNAVQDGLSSVHEALDPRQRRELADIIEHGWGYGWRGAGRGRRCGGHGRWSSHNDDAPPSMI